MEGCHMLYDFSCVRVCLSWALKTKAHLEQAGCEAAPKPEHTFVVHGLPEAVSHACEMDVHHATVREPRTLRLFKTQPEGSQQAEENWHKEK